MTRQLAIVKNPSWLWLVIIAGASLHLYKLGDQSLWIDEGFQYLIANSNSAFDVIHNLLRPPKTGHPPLSYVINHLFLTIHNSDFFLRLPSALFGIASLPLCYMLAKKMLSKQAALFATLIFAISPFHIWYSQEARAYSQLLFFSLLSSVFLINALADSKRVWWALYSIALAAGWYTHLFIALTILAHSIWMLGYQRRHLLAYLTSATVSVLLFLPWVGLFAYHFGLSSKSVGSAAGFSWGVLPYTFFVYSVGFSLGPSVAELHENQSLSYLLQFAHIIFIALAMFLSLFIVGIYGLNRNNKKQVSSFIILSILVPLAGCVIFSLIPGSTFNVRYTVMAFPYFCILVGLGLAFFYQKSGSVSRFVYAGYMASIFVILTISLSNHFYNTRYAKEDIKSAVAYWRATGGNQYLLSNVRYTVDRYLSRSEKSRHVVLPNERNLVPEINEFFLDQDVSSVYVLLVRDWHEKKENLIKNAFLVDGKQLNTGTTILRVSRRALTDVSLSR